MQGEDDLRALAKIMGFIRSVSILILFIHFYWYCYSFFLDQGLTLELINKILVSFQEKGGLFHHWSYSKSFSLLLLVISCFGTKGVKNEKIKWHKIIVVLAFGLIMFFLNYPLLYHNLYFGFGLYIITSSIGFILIMVAGAWMSRLSGYLFFDSSNADLQLLKTHSDFKIYW